MRRSTILSVYLQSVFHDVSVLFEDLASVSDEETSCSLATRVYLVKKLFGSI